MKRILLLTLLGGAIFTSCQMAREPVPSDPKELAKSLGTFKISTEHVFTGEEMGAWYFHHEPVDPNAKQGGALLNGWPYNPPPWQQARSATWYYGGVGRAWILPSPPTPETPNISQFFPKWQWGATMMWAAYRGLYRGGLEMEYFVQVYGRWYRVRIPVEVGITPEGSRLVYRPGPAEAYPLPDLPEIDLYGQYPPLTTVAVCAQPTGWRKDDPYALAQGSPHLAKLDWNAHYILAYRRGRLYHNSYDPTGDGLAALCFGCLGWEGIPEGTDFFYDYFVVMMNKDPRQASGYRKWWHIYNKEPLRVERNPDGTYTCHGFEEANASVIEGPFTEEEFKRRFFDPTSPPKELPGRGVAP